VAIGAGVAPVGRVSVGGSVGGVIAVARSVGGAGVALPDGDRQAARKREKVRSK
jgi:hypothetical protein